jgi:tRNA (guanine-N7-)-methyltransferase
MLHTVGKNKLQKFEDISGYPHVFQYPFAALKQEGFELKAHWNSSFFKNDHPIILELGCGKGEYAVGLAQQFPEKNFIGIDIKGARIWSGAKEALDWQLSNVAFLRTHIELLAHFFAPGEVSEIWITFPDPQMKKVNKRLTSTRFMKLYSEIMTPNGHIHLKTDSPFLFTYTREMIRANNLPLEVASENIDYHSPDDERLSIPTAYEKLWRSRGLLIKYLRFVCSSRESYAEPQTEIARDTYRSVLRGR